MNGAKVVDQWDYLYDAIGNRTRRADEIDQRRCFTLKSCTYAAVSSVVEPAVRRLLTSI
jgi:hypothetical protein